MQTQFATIDNYVKGRVDVIDDRATDYAFSNVFDVAAKSRPYEKVAVARNLKYVLEAIRAEGVSPWFANAHDEAVIAMDGDIRIQYIQPNVPAVACEHEGSVRLAEEPAGRRMGWVRLQRGHMALLPAGAAYQFESLGARPGALLLQTIMGSETVERWADICQTA